ncbi:MAG: hypothetical protein JJT78_05865 [Leptospira sp.]|nr:hypothetical protein [Leptospira sp.]
MESTAIDYLELNMKIIFSSLSIAITLFSFLPYILAIYRKEKIPHYFSWIIWGSTTFIVGLAQFTEGGGWGSYPILISGILTLIVSILSFIRRESAKLKAMDWFFLISSLGSIPLWWILESPLWSVILLTFIDVMGFGPTIRKAYENPREESPLFYTWFAIRNLLVLGALESYSTTTVLFPLATGLGCVLLVGIILVRGSE